MSSMLPADATQCCLTLLCQSGGDISLYGELACSFALFVAYYCMPPCGAPDGRDNVRTMGEARWPSAYMQRHPGAAWFGGSLQSTCSSCILTRAWLVADFCMQAAATCCTARPFCCYLTPVQRQVPPLTWHLAAAVCFDCIYSLGLGTREVRLPRLPQDNHTYQQQV